MKSYIRLGKKLYTVKEWNLFDYPHQSVLLRKFDIILTDHQTRTEKLQILYKKIKHIDIDKSLTKVTNTIDDFCIMMDGMKGIGGKQKDLSGLLGTRKSNQKKGKPTL